MSRQTLAVNPKTAGRGYLTDPGVWAVVAGILAGAATTKLAITAARPVFGTADTARALPQRQLLLRAALSAGVAVAGIAISEGVPGYGRPVGLGIYAIGVVHILGRAAQAAGWDVI